jgi:signal transduction histidine kinase
MTQAPASTGAFYRFVAAHPRFIDVLIASTVLFFTGLPYLASLIASLVTSGPDVAHNASLLGLDLALVLPLYWRRTNPIAAAAVMLVPCLIQLIGDVELVAGQVSVLIIISALAAYAPRWASRGGLALGVVGILLLGIRTSGFATNGHAIIGIAIFVALGWSMVGVAWLSGDLTRSRQLERSALSDRADRLERERERELKLAAADERAHIARELHDIIAHSLSIIVTQADGARYAAPPAAGPVVPALEAIAETARTSLTDMRRLLGVFRPEDDEAPTAPSPAVDDIPELIDSVRTSGLPVRFATSGVELRPELAQGAELVLFRVVQESLTNVLKHAGGDARAEVELRWGETAVDVTVRDSGAGMQQSTGESGRGLHGMRERLALYGGELEVSSPAAGGVAIHALLPYDEARRL